MRKILSIFAAMLVAVAVSADPVVLPATLDVNNVSFRSEGMPDFVLEEGDYAGTYFDMGAHDSSNDTLLYAEWDVTIEPMKYDIDVVVYNENSWRVQLYLLNQAGDTLKSLRYKGSSGQKGKYAIGSMDMKDLEAGTYKLRARAATAWSKMKLKDVIFKADYKGVQVALPGTLQPAYAELSANASVTDDAIAFNPSTAHQEYATWNVSFAKAGNFNVSIDYDASNTHTYSVALLSADGLTGIDTVAEASTWAKPGVKDLGAISVPAAGNYKVKLMNATQWSEAVLNSITFTRTNSYYIIGSNSNLDEWNTWYNMNLSADGNYEYFVATSGNCVCKINSAKAWDGKQMGEYNNQPGFNNTSIGGEGLAGSTWTDGDHNACYWYDNDTHDNYYILVYYPNTTVNTTDQPIICASAFLPTGKPSRYVVAGAEAICGSNWDQTDQNNDMIEESAGVYSITYVDLDLAATTYNFKVVKYHTWACGAYPASDYELNVKRSGKYDVTISFNESSSEVAVDTICKQAIVVLPTIQLGGLFDVWTAGYTFTPAEDNLTASTEIEFPEGQTGYSFKVVIDGNWEGKHFTFDRDNTSANEWGGDEAAYIWLDKPGKYEFTWTYASGTLTVKYPDLANAVVTIAAPAHGSISVLKGEVAVASGDNVEELTILTLSLSANTDDYIFSNLRAYLTDDPDSAIAITAGTLRMPGAAITITADEAARRLENGFYLKKTTVDLEDITAALMFSEADEQGERKLITKLVEGDVFKVVEISDDAIVGWYPDGIDNDYTVDAKHAGKAQTIYFRQADYEGEGWWYKHIYVPENSDDPTALDNTNVDAETIKSIENGQFFIIKNGVRYSVTGQVIR